MHFLHVIHLDDHRYDAALAALGYTDLDRAVTILLEDLPDHKVDEVIAALDAVDPFGYTLEGSL